MSKAFTKESDQDDEDQDTGAPARPADAALEDLSAVAGGTTARAPDSLGVAQSAGRGAQGCVAQR